MKHETRSCCQISAQVLRIDMVSNFRHAKIQLQKKISIHLEGGGGLLRSIQFCQVYSENMNINLL